MNGKCSNTDGGFECACNRGFSGDGFSCSDNDECADSPCDSNASCNNFAGGFECACNSGYSGDGFNCSDIDECAEISCQDNASCQNTDGGYQCVCNQGYEDKNGECADVNECKSKPCGDNAYCVNKPGRFVCKCRKGFFGNGDDCQDVDECANGKANCDANASCSNTVGSYECSCDQGYQGDGESCSDVNECNFNPCQAYSNCENTEGGFECNCQSGFEANGNQCTDINECAGENACSENASCFNQNGSYRCTCDRGFIGDGRSCTATYSANANNQVFDANGNLIEVNTGDDRTEGQEGAAGTFGFNGDFGSNSYGFASAGSNAYGAYDYGNPFAGLNNDYFNDMTVGSDGVDRFGVAGVDDAESQWWSFMHQMWNHVQESRRDYAEAKPARVHSYASRPGFDVTSNLVDSTPLAGHFVTNSNLKDGYHGKGLRELNAAKVGHSPWDVLNDNIAVNTNTISYGHDELFGQSTTGNGLYDSSWELGVPDTDQHATRWFEGTQSGNGGTNSRDDPARLKCHHCEVQYMLKWHSTDKVFKQYKADGSEPGVSGGAWIDCDATTDSRFCEYSSGVCFVEERRTFGYITLVRKGCKQAKACYMNKYQNFLVQAGRQCWPGDGRSMAHKVARRPTDLNADEWIYNLLKGGNTSGTSAIGESFKDVTFGTDLETTATATNGFYVSPDINDILADKLPMAYQNGNYRVVIF